MTMEVSKVLRLPRHVQLLSSGDTAAPIESQRIEMRHVAASKRAFRARPSNFSHFVATKSTFSYKFYRELKNLLPQNRCFVWCFRQCSAHLTKCHTCHVICTLSPLDAALTMRFAKARNMTRLKCCACHAKWPCVAPATKNAVHLLKRRKGCACHTKRLSTRSETCWNVTKCHACQVKRGSATSETSKSDNFCNTRHRHGHSVLARTVANGCGRLQVT